MGDARPRIARKARLRWDRVDETYFLLWPERGMRLNATAAAIVELCDGMRSRSEIVREVATRFAATETDVASDIDEFLDELGRRALVVER